MTESSTCILQNCTCVFVRKKQFGGFPNNKLLISKFVIAYKRNSRYSHPPQSAIANTRNTRKSCEMCSKLTTKILRISPYSVRMQENTDQDNSEYGLFLRSIFLRNGHPVWVKFSIIYLGDDDDAVHSLFPQIFFEIHWYIFESVKWSYNYLLFLDFL